MLSRALIATPSAPAEESAMPALSSGAARYPSLGWASSTRIPHSSPSSSSIWP
jgi:hypothetical protein